VGGGTTGHTLTLLVLFIIEFATIRKLAARHPPISHSGAGRRRLSAGHEPRSLAQIFDAYLDKKQMAQGALRFLYDGKRINPTMTVAEMELEDGAAPRAEAACSTCCLPERELSTAQVTCWRLWQSRRGPHPPTPRPCPPT